MTMYSLWLLIYNYLRPFIKWFLRKTTGLCELQRICYGEIEGSRRIKGIEESLFLSKSPHINRMTNHLNEVSDNRRFLGNNRLEIIRGSVNTILLVKEINSKLHSQFVTSISKSIEQIWGYRQLIAEVEALRQTTYDADNLDHEQRLYALWSMLVPDELLEARTTKQWQSIGFQGDDPKTDFRGMGMLGLENLLFFASEYNGAASHVLSHSHHPEYGYAFAVVGINITSMAWNLLKNGSAKTYFYNNYKEMPSLKLFHQFYCYLFYEFDKYWIESRPKNIMEFSSVKEKFENNIRISLLDPSAVFRINISVESV